MAWFAVQQCFAAWWFPARLRPPVLRVFGATVGERVLVRHGVRVHRPWKLTVGGDCWIGEGVWLLDLEPITIGSDVCLSQGAFLCTGGHDARSPTFEFDNAPITIGDGAWVAAHARVLRGVGVGVGGGAVVGTTALVTRDVAAGETVLAPRAR